VGIFSRFKRNNERADEAAPDTRLRTGEPSRLPQESEAERARLREIARATAAKIDAIESAMANDIFNTPEPAWGSAPRRPRTAPAAATAASLELAATELLAEDQLPATAAPPQCAPLMEESAILYANGQIDAAGQMLRQGIGADAAGERGAWWMLFDLYQAGKRQEDFDNLAIDYASRFEASPPAWTAPVAGAGKPYAGVAPTEVLEGILDTHIAVQLQRLVELAAPDTVLRLELGRVTGITPQGCTLLAGALDTLRKRGSALVVAGASELAGLARQAAVIGERGESQAPWLLLLALLQLLNREKEYEEAAMDYCVTFELSPPSFEAPASVATAPAGPPVSDRFLLPPVLEGDVSALLDAIAAYADASETVLLDCSRLVRADYAAASALAARLRPLAAGGKKIELRELNHMVAALFRLLGFAGVARLFPHKY
jgi:ABC-type transporter Mla MlaB component